MGNRPIAGDWLFWPAGVRVFLRLGALGRPSRGWVSRGCSPRRGLGRAISGPSAPGLLRRGAAAFGGGLGWLSRLRRGFGALASGRPPVSHVSRKEESKKGQKPDLHIVEQSVFMQSPPEGRAGPRGLSRPRRKSSSISAGGGARRRGPRREKPAALDLAHMGREGAGRLLERELHHGQRPLRCPGRG